MRGRSTVLALLLAFVYPLPAPEEVIAPVSSRAPGARVVWVALENAGQIVKVDIAAKRILKRKSVSGAPHNLSISPSGETVGATLWSGDNVVLRHRGVQRQVRLGGAPHDVKIGGGRVVVANQTEARLDIVSRKGKSLGSIGLKTDPHDLALRRGGREAWVTLEGDDDLAVVNLRTKSVRYVSTGKAPHDILFAPGGRLWVTDWSAAVHVFSRRGRMIRTIPLGVEAHHLDFTPDGRQAWITDNAAQRVFVVRTKTFKIAKRFEVRGAPHHIAITPDGDRAVVADHDRGLLIVYNINKLRRTFTIDVGAGPHGIWAMP